MRFRVSSFGFSLTLCVLGVASAATAADDKATQADFFEKRVRPLLIDRCLDCHSEDNSEANLRLDSLAGMLKGGLRGPTIVPGKPEVSLLIRALRHSERLQMPPKQKLPTAEIAVFAQWIKDGAVWPNADPVNPVTDDLVEYEFTAEQKSFWAFQKPVSGSLPEVKNIDWVHSPIDAFVLARLEGADLSPAPPADRRRLMRRVTFDLTGLPPTPDEVDAFLTDDSPQAFARVVDRLLASPHYGERWGRHWLDVARYADSNGLDENLCHANAFRYRDYVIRAFNDDKPFNRFVQEQIAGDLLTDDGSPNSAADGVVATGFLVIGPKMLAEDDPVKLHMDIIDEQIDTIGRAFMGMTLGCARCHDHKFDPIPTADYYSLAGVFKSTHTMNSLNVVAQWHERPLADPEVLAARDAQQLEITGLETQIARLRDAATRVIVDQARRNAGDYLLAAEAFRRGRALLASAEPVGRLASEKHPPGTILIEAEKYDRGNVSRDTTSYGVGIGVLVNRGETPNFVEYDIEIPAAGTYQFEVRVAAAASRPCTLAVNGSTLSSNFAAAVTGTWFPDTQKWFVEGHFPLKAGKNVVRLSHTQFFPHIDKLLLTPVSERRDVSFEPLNVDAQLIPEFVTQWADRLDADVANSESPLADWLSQAKAADHVASLRELARQLAEHATASESGDDDRVKREGFRKLLDAADGPFRVTDSISNKFPEPTRAQLAQLAEQKSTLEKALPSLPLAMAVKDTDAPADIRVHYRGNHLTQGPVVPRRFPRIMTAHAQESVADARSGRLELAQWLTSPEHPLTARVIVNRVWHWHFGQGLVRSPDNFGRLGERPTHPRLLDWLAVKFVASGWSLKSLHRLILLSSTWQMSGRDNPPAAAIDPENRLLWHRPRRRLEAEEIRDSILAAAGRLDTSMRGSLLTIENRKYVTSTANVDPVVYDTRRRSVYLPVVRSAVYEVLQAFDFADPGVSSGTRQSTTVAPQALFMMNSSFVSEHTQALAGRLSSDHFEDDTARVRQLYLNSLSRLPTDSEVARTLGFIDAYEQRILTARPDIEDARVRAWQSLARVLFGSNEFVFVD